MAEVLCESADVLRWESHMRSIVHMRMTMAR